MGALEKMIEYIRKAKNVDVMFFAEGTYPYVRGGVSSWIHQIINGMPSIKFGVCFMGSRPEDYEGIKYELPDNLIHLEVSYLFGNIGELSEPIINDTREKEIELHDLIDGFHKVLKSNDDKEAEKYIQDYSFFSSVITERYFSAGKASWDYLCESYLKECPDVPFVDYFWTIRNIHSPIWLLARVANSLPECKVLHAPSTGYAGFIATLSSYFRNTPFLLTEHGIYTRERKIELLSADWITYRKPLLLQEVNEKNPIKEAWVKFFSRLGAMCYTRADRIFSLFSRAREIQIAYGAKEEKCEVIPNGVNLKRFEVALNKRQKEIPPVVTLIGRVVPIKDIKTFIRAIRITAETIPDVKGWIVGPLDEDKEYADECFRIVKALGLEENMEFLGFQNIVDIFPKSGLQTLTSISEGMPLVILEGFAAGLPCVATDVGSCRDLIEGSLDEQDIAIGKAGAVTEIANPSQLANEYIKFLTDSDLWYRSQEAALKRVRTYYEESMFMKRYEDYYKKAMKYGRDWIRA